MRKALRAVIVDAIAAALLAGCQFQAPVSSDPTGARVSRLDWTVRIEELMPAIRVCANDPTRPAANVLKAWPTANDLVAVRMTDLTGMRVDCIAERGGGRIDSVAEVAASDVLPSEGRPIFYPVARGEPLCGALDPVRVNGILEGWKRSIACE